MRLKITLIKSPIGYRQDQAATARALGLRRLHHSVVQEDSPSVRGMVTKIRHLVRVETVDEAPKGAAPRAETTKGAEAE